MNTNKHKNIIELLKQDYLLINDGNLKQKVGEIVQEHIQRSLYNSTACITKQLKANYDHIDGLIDYIIESLKKDFTSIPLSQCQGQLHAIADNEYKRLVPFANDFLVKAGLASQSILGNFEQVINNKKEETKQAIEMKIAIIEKQKSSTAKKKLWYKKAWPYILGAIMLTAALLAILWYAVDLKERFFPRK